MNVRACRPLLIASTSLLALMLPACGESCMCACPPAVCVAIRTTAQNGGTTVGMEVGQWISLQLPGPNTRVTGASSDPSVLKPYAEQLSGDFGAGPMVYMSFHALKEGSAQLSISATKCDSGSPTPCSYSVTVRVVQLPKTTIDVSVGATPATIDLSVGESARFTAECPASPADNPSELPTIDRPDIVRWAVEPFFTQRAMLRGAVTAVSPGTAHVSGAECQFVAPTMPFPGAPGPSTWTLTVVVI